MNNIALDYTKKLMQRVLATILFLAIVFAIDLYVFQGFKVVVKKWFPAYSGLAHFLYWAIPFFLLALVLVRVVWFPESPKNNYFIFVNINRFTDFTKIPQYETCFIFLKYKMKSSTIPNCLKFNYFSFHYLTIG